MKKFTFLFIAFLICVTSCERDKETLTDNSLSELKLLSENYIKEQSKNQDAYRWPPRWLSIVFADAIGALTGGAIGSGGGPAGTVIGAVAGGVAASVAVGSGHGTTGPIPPDPETPGVILSFPGNPHDNIGHLHYEVISGAITSPANYLDSNGQYNPSALNRYQKSYYTNNSIFSARDINAYFNESNINSCVTFTKDIETIDVYQKLNILYNDGKISATVNSVLNNYFKSYESSRDLDSFITYSKTAENIVVNSSFTSRDKDLILITMATTRYGSAYWN